MQIAHHPILASNYPRFSGKTNQVLLEYFHRPSGTNSLVEGLAQDDIIHLHDLPRWMSFPSVVRRIHEYYIRNVKNFVYNAYLRWKIDDKNLYRHQKYILLLFSQFVSILSGCIMRTTILISYTRLNENYVFICRLRFRKKKEKKHRYTSTYTERVIARDGYERSEETQRGEKKKCMGDWWKMHTLKSKSG